MQAHDYIRHGTTSLFAVLEVATRKVVGQCHRRHRGREFLKHLDAHYPEADHSGEEFHLILDNYATHQRPAGVCSVLTVPVSSSCC